MGLFDHLFGKKKLAKDILAKSEDRIALFNDHMEESGAKIRFFTKNSEQKLISLIQDPGELDQLLYDMESSIRKDIVDIEGEEKLETDIIADLGKLSSIKTELEAAESELSEAKNMEIHIRNLFQKYYQILVAELHLVRQIRQKFEEKDFGQVTNLLLSLRKLIVDTEAVVSRLLWHEEWDMIEGLPPKIRRVVHAVLLEKKVNKVPLDYKELLNEIYIDIIEKFGAPFADYEEYEKARTKIDQFIREDTDALRKIIVKELKKQKMAHTETEVARIIKLFRDAYTSLEFREIDLYT